jgi:hypothetical protein
VDGEDRPILAWVENDRVQVGRWTGTHVEPIGDSMSDDGLGAVDGQRELAVAADGRILVAWPTPEDRVHARMWDGSSWIELAGSATGDGLGTSSFRDVDVTFLAGETPWIS